MGKMTLVLSVLHAPEVVDRYKQQYFVSCEAVTSTRLLLGELADVLYIPPTQRNEHLFEPSFRQLVGILRLDKLSISRQFGMMTRIGLKSRNYYRLTSKPLLPPLDPLSSGNSSQLLEALCGLMDGYADIA